MCTKVAVIGAGRMGLPMARTLAAAGCHVELVDLKPGRTPAADAGPPSPAPPPRRTSAAGSGQPPIEARRAPGPWLREIGILFEALPERLEVKQAGYRALAPYLSPDALIGSTTSSFTPEELAPAIPAPERFMLTHWLYPPDLMPLVEVAPGPATSPAAVEQMLSFLKHIGKVPVRLNGTPGLAVVRLQALIMNEAARMADEGVAAPEVIDQAVRLGLAFRFLAIGPLEFTDLGGIDTLYYSSRNLTRSLAAERFTPAAGVTARTDRGEIGVKSGRGFYDWSDATLRQRIQAALDTYPALLGFLGLALPGAGPQGGGNDRR